MKRKTAPPLLAVLLIVSLSALTVTGSAWSPDPAPFVSEFRVNSWDPVPAPSANLSALEVDVFDLVRGSSDPLASWSDSYNLKNFSSRPANSLEPLVDLVQDRLPDFRPKRE